METAVLTQNIFKCRNFELDLSQGPCIMGILNVTPDSFSDGGVYFDKALAIEHAIRMQEEGAEIIDIGAQSTRPGAVEVPPDEQLKRIEKIVKVLGKKLKVPISIDTSSAIVAAKCLDLGASMINDIYALRQDSELGSLIARHKAGVVLMHMQKNPQTMQKNPVYKNVILEITEFLKKVVKNAISEGIAPESIMIDPGIGFGKTTEHNLKIISFLSEFKAIDKPIMIGTSRKSFIGNILGNPINEREFGTAASIAISVLNGADVLRVHSVAQAKDVVRLTQAIKKQRL